jgi:hypothetical protein
LTTGASPIDAEAESLSARAEAEGFVGLPLPTRPCKVCGSDAPLFGVVDFNRSCGADPYPDGLTGVPVYWHRCTACGLLFTPAFDRFSGDGWREHVYNPHYYAALDPDYAAVRPGLNAELVRAVCRAQWGGQTLGLDYGGGNGELARRLSVAGLRFLTHDPYGASDDTAGLVGRFNVLTSFEVLEHTVDPQQTLADLLRFAAERVVVIASTQCADGLVDEHSRLSWNYIAPRNGHVTIYARRTLSELARQHRLDHLAVSRGLHLFGRGVDLGRLKWVAGWVKLKQRLRSTLRA